MSNRIKPENLMTSSLSRTNWGWQAARIITDALLAVDPERAVRSHIALDGQTLIASGQVYDLNQIENIYVIGAGKAGEPMSRAVVELLGRKITGGRVIVKEGHSTRRVSDSAEFTLFEAGHPLPDQRGVNATQKIISLLQPVTSQDLVICLISGGGSALLTKPADGITLEQIRNLTSHLLASGATINEINTIRKHIDLVKGGQLARLAYPARLLTLILSDVVGNPLDIIASGPTVPDESTFSQALEILKKYSLYNQVSRTIVKRLEAGANGAIPETPKSIDPVFQSTNNVLVGSNHLAAQAAVRKARNEGLRSHILTTSLVGEAREQGRMLASLARRVVTKKLPITSPVCIIAGGETTVTLQGDGYGGRNQELALAAVEGLSGLKDVAIITIATDGGDGPTDAAGAVVTGETLVRANLLNISPQSYLERNDSYHFFEALSDLIKTGPTLTNVNDLVFIFVF